MIRLSDADMWDLPMHETEIEYQIALKNSEKENEELHATVARLQNHVISTDKENASLKDRLKSLGVTC